MGLRVETREGLEDLNRRIDTATANHARQDRARLQRQTAFDRVSGAWRRRVELESQVTQLRQEETTLAASVATTEEAGRVATAAATRHGEERGLAHNLQRRLREARDELAPLIARLTQALADAGGAIPLPPRATFVHLRNALVEAIWTSDQIQHRLSRIRDARAATGQAQVERDRLRALRAQLDQLLPLLPSGEDLAAHRLAADEASARAASARAHFEAMSVPITRLQAAGREFLSHGHSETVSECPLCGHDWDTLGHLREAIGRTLAGAPQLLQIAEMAAADAARTADEARAAYDAALTRHHDGEKLVSEVNAASQLVEARRRRYLEIGVDPDSPDLPRMLAQLEHRLLVAQAVVDLARVRDGHGPQGFGFDAPILAELANLATAQAQLFEAVRVRTATLEQNAAAASSNEASAAEDRDRLRAELAIAQSNLGDLRSRIAAAVEELERLRALWRQAAPGHDWTPDGLDLVREELAMEAAKLAAVDARLAAARAARATEVRLARLSELAAQIAPMKERRDPMRKRLAAARRAAKTFRETYAEISGRHVRALSRVVNPLFARMHANRVFDEIDMGQAENFLHWLATAGEAQLDPKTDFSHGQRQDLALALFLARARGLGGTFFLDEPVTHLDDLNRVGLLDVFRATVMESSERLNLVVTTASRALARHMVEKFMNVGPVPTAGGSVRPLRVIELRGNARTGVSMSNVYPLSAAA